LFKKKQEASLDADSGEFRSRAESDTKAARSRGKRSEGVKKNQADDPLLPEKKRARRRLIGAIALVLAAVIGLPMILDSEPKPLADDINIQIPSKDKPLSSGVGAISKENAAILAAASAEQDAPRAAGKTATVAKTARTIEPVEEIVDPASLTDNKNTPATREIPAPAVAPVNVPANKLATHQESKPEHKAEAKPVAAPRNTEKNTAGNAAVASEQKNSTAKPASKAADSTDDAARALAILEGKSPAKAAAKPAAEAVKSEKASSGFVLQVAALASPEKVDELQGKLKSAGIRSYTQKVATTTGEKIRIRVGPFESREEADKMHAKLAKLGLGGTLVPN